MIDQKKKTKSRVGKFGASDTHYIMGNWDTVTFINWWQTKMGIKVNDFRNVYTIAGTYKEHQLADWYEQKHKCRLVRDRRVKVRGTKLVVNLDSETKDTVVEIKTHKQTDKDWQVPKNYWMQVQVQEYATKKKGKILDYALTEEDYNNFYLPIDESRVGEHDIPYDEQWVKNEYLPRLVYLAECLKKRKTPNMREFNMQKLKTIEKQTGINFTDIDKLKNDIKNFFTGEVTPLKRNKTKKEK